MTKHVREHIFDCYTLNKSHSAVYLLTVHTKLLRKWKCQRKHVQVNHWLQPPVDELLTCDANSCAASGGFGEEVTDCAGCNQKHTILSVTTVQQELGNSLVMLCHVLKSCCWASLFGWTFWKRVAIKKSWWERSGLNLLSIEITILASDCNMRKKRVQKVCYHTFKIIMNRSFYIIFIV